MKDSFLAMVAIDPEDNSAALTRINFKMSPDRFASLPSGMFLLSGILHSTQMNGKEFRQSAKMFTGIFDSRGTLIKEIELPGDVTGAE